MTGDHDIHAARFGNRSGAHDVLLHTGAPQGLVDGIKWYTDRPGTRWDDSTDRVYAAYSSQGYYAVQVTVLDDLAPRSGMVATTVLLIPHRLVGMVDLGRAFKILDELAETSTLHAIPSTSLEFVGACPHAPGAAALADVIAATGEAVWVGPGYTEAFACLWRHLGDDDRLQFAFTATDHPELVALPRDHHGWRILVTPDPLPGPFADVSTVGVTSNAESAGPSSAMLEPDRHPASLLASKLSLTRPTLRQWHLLLALRQELDEIQTGRSDHVVAALSLLGALAPDPAVGVDLKREVIAQLQGLLSEQPYTTVRSLRTVPWEALPTPASRKMMVANWVKQCAARQDTTALADALQDLQRRERSWYPELRTEIVSRAAIDRQLAAAIIATLSLRSDGRAATAMMLSQAHVGDPVDFDVELSDALRQELSPGSGAAPWIVKEAVSKGWATTHAVVVDTSDEVAAWRVHLSVATDTSAEVLASRTAAASTVAAAVEFGHPVLMKHAGRLAAADPGLLNPARPAERNYRRVWAAAVHCGMEVTACYPADQAAPPLVDAWLNGDEVDEVLLGGVLDDAGVILAAHPSRPTLWTRTGTPIVERLRAATAANAARRMRLGDPQPEPELANRILATATLRALARELPAQAVTVLEALGGIARDRHGESVATYATRLAPEAARRLGALARTRGWQRTAKQMVTSGRADMQPGVPEAVDALGFFDRLFLARRTGGGVIPEPSAEETASALVAELSDIYPAGPTTELWERAGGQAAELPRASTGRSAWNAALREIRVGSGGAPSLKRLLEEALRDHPRNTRLSILVEHSGKRHARRKK